MPKDRAGAVGGSHAKSTLRKECHRLVQEAFSKAAQIILQSKILQFQQQSSNHKLSKWFRLRMQEYINVSQEIREWKTDAFQPLIIEIVYNPADGTPTAGLSLVESWCIDYTPLDKIDESATLAAVHKRVLIMMRALYIYVHMMPARALFKRFIRRKVDARLQYRFKDRTEHDSPNFGDAIPTSKHAFDGITTPYGKFTVSTIYRTKCDFAPPIPRRQDRLHSALSGTQPIGIPRQSQRRSRPGSFPPRDPRHVSYNKTGARKFSSLPAHTDDFTSSPGTGPRYELEDPKSTPETSPYHGVLAERSQSASRLQRPPGRKHGSAKRYSRGYTIMDTSTVVGVVTPVASHERRSYGSAEFSALTTSPLDDSPLANVLSNSYESLSGSSFTSTSGSALTSSLTLSGSLGSGAFTASSTGERNVEVSSFVEFCKVAPQLELAGSEEKTEVGLLFEDLLRLHDVVEDIEALRGSWSV